MKVPIMYKSSDRYNAGTDVIYNDDSKLQFAPFIYASVTAKDNGGGDDDEGDDTMLITVDTSTNNWTMDKTAGEIKQALNSGKLCFAMAEVEDVNTILYIRAIEADNISCFAVDIEDELPNLGLISFDYSEDSDYPVYVVLG